MLKYGRSAVTNINWPRGEVVTLRSARPLSPTRSHSQVVRQGSAKPLCVGATPTATSKLKRWRAGKTAIHGCKSRRGLNDGKIKDPDLIGVSAF